MAAVGKRVERNIAARDRFQVLAQLAPPGELDAFGCNAVLRERTPYRAPHEFFTVIQIARAVMYQQPRLRCLLEDACNREPESGIEFRRALEKPERHVAVLSSRQAVHRR